MMVEKERKKLGAKEIQRRKLPLPCSIVEKTILFHFIPLCFSGLKDFSTMPRQRRRAAEGRMDKTATPDW